MRKPPVRMNVIIPSAIKTAREYPINRCVNRIINMIMTVEKKHARAKSQRSRMPVKRHKPW